MGKIKAGIIGCGNISEIYFTNGKALFEGLEVAACADLDLARAKAKAEKHGVIAYSVEELLADPQIQLVINLTIPKVHAKVNLQALHAGKHVYVEKPFAVTREEAQEVIQLAKEKGLLVGTAPDTFLGGGIQTCIKLIQDGEIGVPVAATAFMLCGGHESWHPDPEFYYQAGGGPMFDMGPYYLTALVALLGPIQRVTGSARITYPERKITSQPKNGQKIQVEVPTHVAGVLDFQSGAIGTIITSFDVPGGQSLPNIEIYGSKGTLSVPDPNGFGGIVKLRNNGSSEWKEIPLTHGFQGNCRGIGAADMAQAILQGRKHRASGALGYHVLEAMIGIHHASAEGKHYNMQSNCELPDPLPEGETKF
jgi:predicted dehydrogenase